MLIKWQVDAQTAIAFDPSDVQFVYIDSNSSEYGVMMTYQDNTYVISQWYRDRKLAVELFDLFLERVNKEL